MPEIDGYLPKHTILCVAFESYTRVTTVLCRAQLFCVVHEREVTGAFLIFFALHECRTERHSVNYESFGIWR